LLDALLPADMRGLIALTSLPIAQRRNPGQRRNPFAVEVTQLGQEGCQRGR
jgi:hypothetical protein